MLLNLVSLIKLNLSTVKSPHKVKVGLPALSKTINNLHNLSTIDPSSPSAGKNVIKLKKSTKYSTTIQMTINQNHWST